MEVIIMLTKKLLIATAIVSSLASENAHGMATTAARAARVAGRRFASTAKLSGLSRTKALKDKVRHILDINP